MRIRDQAWKKFGSRIRDGKKIGSGINHSGSATLAEAHGIRLFVWECLRQVAGGFFTWSQCWGSGSGMNNPNIISATKPFFGLKYLNSLMRIRYGKNSDPKSGKRTALLIRFICVWECLGEVAGRVGGFLAAAPAVEMVPPPPPTRQKGRGRLHLVTHNIYTVFRTP
jgi:hypothetical protein